MKEIIEILTEGMTLEKAIRVKKSKKDMQMRWIKRTFIPSLIGVVLMAFFMFGTVVLCSVYDGSLDIHDAKEMESIGIALIMLVAGFLVGMMTYEMDNEVLIAKAIDPVVDSALDELAGKKDESE